MDYFVDEMSLNIVRVALLVAWLVCAVAAHEDDGFCTQESECGGAEASTAPPATPEEVQQQNGPPSPAPATDNAKAPAGNEAPQPQEAEQQTGPKDPYVEAMLADLLMIRSDCDDVSRAAT